MNSQIYLWEITRYLAWFTSQVKIENKNGNFDINKYAESFLIPILNEIYKKNFVRLEFIKQNYPAIDLGSEDNQMSIQVTSEIGYDKIKNTLTKYIENKLFNTFSELYHLVIDEDFITTKTNKDISDHINIELKKLDLCSLPKVDFTIEKHLLNISALRALIEKKCNIDELKKIRDYLEKQYGKVTALPFFDDILIPYQVAFKTQMDLENKNLPNQFHTPFFGRTQDIKKLEDFINDKEKDVFALISDGGYGKTRLVVEIFNKYASDGGEFVAFLLNESAFQCLDFAEQLKTDKNVLILFDDAHNKPEILNDVIGVAQRLKNVKVILTLRKAVYSETIKTVSSHRRSFETHELGRLSYEETQQLFKSQLPGLRDFEIKKLSEESRGVPIVILGLCQVTLNGKYESGLSEEANFIQFVKEIKEQVISDIHKKYYIDKEKINKTIQLISYFSPIKNIPEEICELARLNSIDIEETNLIIDYLNEYGFISRHHEISIKPDPYSDTILLGSAQRLKYLLQKDLRGFIDRLIRNLVQVEQSQRLDLSIDNLLFEFISSFKNKSTETYNDIKILESNLDTLKSFTYKKPQICFIAINHLITSQFRNDGFWKDTEQNSYSNPLKKIHESIETILSIVTLNTHKVSEFDSIYELLIQYANLKTKSKIFKNVFQYRIYDFVEYGYRTSPPCERQQYLINKLKYRVEHEEITNELFNHILDSCQTILAYEFEGENHYDKYTHSLYWGRHHVVTNKTIEGLRKDAINLLMVIYIIKRHTPESEECLDQLTRILFYMAKPGQKEYQLNQKEEIEIVSKFLKDLLNNRPSILERGNLLKQLKLFERKELKKEYLLLFQELIDIAESVKTKKEKLELIFYDDYFSVRENIKETFERIIEEYNDWNTFFIDLIDIKSRVSKNDYSNFYEITSYLISKYPNEVKNLLEYVYLNNPELICDFSTLIKANYKDQEYFYKTINKIWALELDCVKGTVLWMLTNGRNREVELYKESDLDFVEQVIQKKLLHALWSISFTLPKYMVIAPDKTIDLISQILKISENSKENEHLIHALFEDKELLKANANLIKTFIFKETLTIPLDSYYFDNALFFLEDNFGFNCLFDYLKERVSILEKENDYFSLSLHQHYNNPNKNAIQTEVDFLTVIKWYAELPVKNEYLHKKIVEFLRPTQLISLEFSDGLKELIFNAGDDKSKIIDLFIALDVYENKSENIIGLIIEIVNELCNKFEFDRYELTQIFGSNFIDNLGMKFGSGSGPFPQDLNKRDELNMYLNKYPMHNRVRDIFTYALEQVNKDIESVRFRDMDEKW